MSQFLLQTFPTLRNIEPFLVIKYEPVTDLGFQFIEVFETLSQQLSRDGKKKKLK